MKDRTITYRGVVLSFFDSGYGEFEYRYGDSLFSFDEVCDLIDVDLLSAGVDLFENTEHLSRSERVRKDLLGKGVVVGFVDGRSCSGVLKVGNDKLFVHSSPILDHQIDDSRAVVKEWSVLTMDQKSLFVDLHTWGGALREAKAEVVRCENKVESLFNQIKNI